jgi:hypothetical protein
MSSQLYNSVITGKTYRRLHDVLLLIISSKKEYEWIYKTFYTIPTMNKNPCFGVYCNLFQKSFEGLVPDSPLKVDELYLSLFTLLFRDLKKEYK